MSSTYLSTSATTTSPLIIDVTSPPTMRLTTPALKTERPPSHRQNRTFAARRRSVDDIRLGEAIKMPGNSRSADTGDALAQPDRSILQTCRYIDEHQGAVVHGCRRGRRRTAMAGLGSRDSRAGEG
jgi:hypothetical protein